MDKKELTLIPKKASDDLLFTAGFGMAYSSAKTKCDIVNSALTTVGGAVVTGVSSYFIKQHAAENLSLKEKVFLAATAAVGAGMLVGGVTGMLMGKKALKEINNVNKNFEAAIAEIDGAIIESKESDGCSNQNQSEN